MAKLRVHSLSISFDGYAAGPSQTRETPLGVGGEDLHGWLVASSHWRGVHNREGGEEGVDNQWAAREDENGGAGATIMGRNMFGPVRGPWPDQSWRGWWGENPPYHHPVFVLTHHARDPIPMKGGTTFHFVTGGIEMALEQAVAGAKGKDVRLGGGASTIQEYLRAGLVDEMHVAISPILLGSGERFFEGLGADFHQRYEIAEFAGTAHAAHARIVRKR
jgi:dihydrofolate reductase